MDLVRWLRNQWDRAAAVAAVVVGGIALALGYFGVSRSTLATQQIPYLASGGLLGIFALGFGATLWLSADLRDEWRKLEDIHRDVRSIAEHLNGAQPAAAASTVAPNNGDGRALSDKRLNRPLRAGAGSK